jgi:hypothetical protein
MKVAKRAAGFAAILVLAAVGARGADGPPARQDLEDELQVYEQRVELQQDRVSAIVNKLKVTDSQIERRVERVTAYVAKVTDGQGAGTKVTRAKQDLYESIGKSIDFYAKERGRRFAELYRPHSTIAKEALAEDVQWLNERIEKRVDQALALVVSMPEEKDIPQARTERDLNGYARVSSNPEYDHQRQVSSRAGQVRKQACDQLKASIGTLAKNNAELERALTYAKTDEGRAFVQELLARNNSLVERRRSQIEAARLQANPAAKALGNQAANALLEQIADERKDSQKDFADWTRLKSERDVERARLFALQARLESLRNALGVSGKQP